MLASGASASVSPVTGETIGRALSPVEATQSPPTKFSSVRTVTAIETPFSSGSNGQCPLSGRLGRPVAVERALYLDEPDDSRDEEDPEREQPEAGPARHGWLLAVVRVHLPDLGWDHEGVHGRDQDPDDEAEDAS